MRASSWCTSRGLRPAPCDPAALSSCSRRIAASRRSSSNSAASSLESSGSRELPNDSRSNSPMVRSFPAPRPCAVDRATLPAISVSCGNSKWGTQATALTSCLVTFPERPFVTVKTLATGVAALAAVGAAAAGVTCIASVTAVSPRVQPVVFGAPLPQDPPAPVGVDLPTLNQLTPVLNTLQDPSVSFASKGYLIEGGIPVPASLADHELQKAAAKGSLPLTFHFTSITPAGPGTAAATLTATGPHLAPTYENLTFVDQGGWKLSHDSAMTLIQSVRSSGH